MLDEPHFLIIDKKNLIDLFACCKNKQTFLAFVPINFFMHLLHIFYNTENSSLDLVERIIIVAEKPKVSLTFPISVSNILRTL